MNDMRLATLTIMAAVALGPSAAAASGALVRPPAANWSVEAQCGSLSAELHYANSLTEDAHLRAELVRLEVASASGRTTAPLSENEILQAAGWSEGRAIDRVVPSCREDGRVTFHVISSLPPLGGHAPPFLPREQHTFISVARDGRLSVEQGEVTDVAVR